MTFFRCILWSATFDEEVGGMKTLKQEEISGRSYRNLGQARSAIGAFIENAYNRQQAALGSGISLARRVRSNIGETSRGDVTA